MIKTLISFNLIVFVKSNYVRLCFLVILLFAMGFILVSTILDRRVILDTRWTVSERLRQANADKAHMRSEGYDLEHPTFVLARSEVGALSLLYVLYRFGGQPGWRETVPWEIQRLRHVLTALNQWEERNEAAGLIVDDPINQLLHRFVFEFGSTEGLLWEIWLGEFLLENNIPPLSSPYEMSGFQFLYKSLTQLLVFLIPLLIFALNSSIPGTSRIFLHCQPLSKVKVSLAGLLASSAMTWVFFMFILAFGFLVSSIVNGMGYGNFPLSKTQTVADAILFRLLLMPLYIVACGLVEMGGRWIYVQFSKM